MLSTYTKNFKNASVVFQQQSKVQGNFFKLKNGFHIKTELLNWKNLKQKNSKSKRTKNKNFQNFQHDAPGCVQSCFLIRTLQIFLWYCEGELESLALFSPVLRSTT